MTKEKTTTRKYLVFGSNDELNWKQLGEENAASSRQAKERLLKSGDHSYRYWAACPAGNWSVEEPTVVSVEPTIKWKRRDPRQMTVEDVLQPEQQHERVL